VKGEMRKADLAQMPNAQMLYVSRVKRRFYSIPSLTGLKMERSINRERIAERIDEDGGVISKKKVF
jgi:hypothetical protein